MQTEKISRHQFLRNLGLGGAALVAVYCAGAGLSSCTNESNVTPMPMGGFTLDLSDVANAALKNAGGYVIKNDVVIANVGSGSYAAVTLVCTHENLKQVTYKNNEFYCTAHGARFSNDGKGLNDKGKKGLTVYKTSLSGTTLTIS
jgi:cytochrome b6-f complex iron-sulfur subunit